MTKLTAAKRKSIPKSQMAVPSKGTKTGGAVSGSYPIPDAAHARNALARAAGKPVEGQVRAAVHRKFPNIGKSSAKKTKGK